MKTTPDNKSRLNLIMYRTTGILCNNKSLGGFYLARQNLTLPRGGGRGRADPTPKGFSLITFEQNNLETSNLAECNFNNIHIGRYDQI